MVNAVVHRRVSPRPGGGDCTPRVFAGRPGRSGAVVKESYSFRVKRSQATEMGRNADIATTRKPLEVFARVVLLEPRLQDARPEARVDGSV
jgi:hypothetical protein